MAAKWARNRIPVPESLSGDDREAFAFAALDFIRARTAAGKGKGGRNFPKYTTEYVQSLDFKNAGKRSSPVNLKLSGDMIAANDLLSHKKGSVLLGYENGTDENARADGNIRGTYGSKSPNSSKARDFLGLSQGEIDLILERLGLGEESEL